MNHGGGDAERNHLETADFIPATDDEGHSARRASEGPRIIEWDRRPA